MWAKRSAAYFEAAKSLPEDGIDLYPFLLGFAVLISRLLTSGPVYWGDSPALVRAIRSRVYVIHHFPGYWLLNRSAGLFSSGEAGLHALNCAFSVLGVLTFYFTARLIVSDRVARIGAAVYASVFYIWFSGDIHDSCASQIFFPLLMFYCFLRYRESSGLPYLIGASFAFGLGAGFRPSDGAFLVPLFAYFIVRYASLRHIVISLAVAFTVCISWLIPTYIAYSHASAWPVTEVATQGAQLATGISVFRQGVTRNSMANVARYGLPLIVAFWPLSNALISSVKRLKEEQVLWLWLWIVPGSLFFILLYMASAAYLDFLSATVLLLALTVLDGTRPAVPLLVICLVFNALLFLFFVPSSPRSPVPIQIFDTYVGRYTFYGIRHQWWPNLGTWMKQER